MGLDITFYKKLKRVEKEAWDLAVASHEFPDETSEVACSNDWVTLYVNPDFPGREEGVEGEVAYEFTDSDSFQAGSYGGYNRWRSQLAAMAGTNEGELRQQYDDSQPFAPLIWFSDCEGTIGPVVSRRLAADFEKHLEAAEATNDTYFLDRYKEWMEAFQAAADEGCVAFR